MAVISSGLFRLITLDKPWPDFVPATNFYGLLQRTAHIKKRGLCVVVNAASARGKTGSENSHYVKSAVTAPGLPVYTGHREAPGITTPQFTTEISAMKQ